jgi:peptide/nickel transport system substrate-binding protein
MRSARPLKLLAVLLALVSAPASAQPKDELVIGITQFPSTFNPFFDPMATKSYVLGMAQRPIVTYDKNWQLICMLCTEVPTIENGRLKPVERPDGTKGAEITYTLRADAKWGDGRPVTSADVVFAWEVGRHPDVGAVSGEYYRRAEKIDVRDDHTFTVHANKLTYNAASVYAFDPMPSHLEKAAFADPKEYQKRSAFDTDTTNPGLYNGPYRITQVATGSHIVLEPNATWTGEKPHFKRITVRAIENTSAMEANLLSGGIDYIAGETGISLDQALAFEKRHGSKYDITYKAGLIYEHIDLNLDNPILKDKRVRQALLYALDREALSKQLFEGKQPVADSFVSPLDWIATDDLPKYKYDPKRAAELLDQAGWHMIVLGKDGFRYKDGTRRLSLELMTTAGNRSRETVQQVLQSQWRKLGIEVRIRNEPARVLFGQTLKQRQYTGMAMYAWISAPESLPRLTLHSKEIPSAANNWAGQNTPGFSNAEADKVIDQIEVELDRERRKTEWRRLQEIYVEELPVLPLYFRADSYIVPKWLAGIEPTGHQIPTTLWIERWRPRS